MKTYTIGDSVEFATNTGRRMEGQVIRVLREPKGPNLLLIEADQWRVFRHETDIDPNRRTNGS